MRIERIQSVKDVGLWTLDQVGHIALASLPGVILGLIQLPIWLSNDRPDWIGPGLYILAMLGGTALLITREIVQWVEKDRGPGWISESYAKSAEWARRFFPHILYVDPFLDVMVGVAGLAWVWSWLL